MPLAKADGRESETNCYAESRDGIHWTKPDLGLFEVRGTRTIYPVLYIVPTGPREMSFYEQKNYGQPNNFAPSAASGVRLEIQDAAGHPLPGCALTDSVEQIGSEIERAVVWRSDQDVSALARQTISVRFA